MSRRNLGILTFVVAGSLTILPLAGASAAEPLAAGTYQLDLGDSIVEMVVNEDGAVPTLISADGVQALLTFDDEGRVLDEFRLMTMTGDSYDVDLDVQPDGSYSQSVTAVVQDDTATAEDDAQAKITATIAKCAPNGRAAREAGWPNHGTVQRAAARGQSLTFDVVAEDGSVTTIKSDLSTPEGANAFCDVVDAAFPADTGDADVVVVTTADDEATEAKSEKADAKQEAKSEKADAKAQAKQDKKDAKAQAKQDKKDAKAQAKQDKKDAKAQDKAAAKAAKAQAKQDKKDAKAQDKQDSKKSKDAKSDD